MSAGLYFDIDSAQLQAIALDLGATDRQAKLAFSRALSRTAATLRRLSERGMKSELELRTLKLLRIRLKSIKLRRSGAEELGIWYGLNDMPVGEFKGKPTKSSDGAAFRGQDFPGGFTGRNKRRQPTIFKRIGKARLPVAEAEMPVKDKMDVFIEDHVFTQVETVFWKHFRADLAARVKYSIGES